MAPRSKFSFSWMGPRLLTSLFDSASSLTQRSLKAGSPLLKEANVRDEDGGGWSVLLFLLGGSGRRPGEAVGIEAGIKDSPHHLTCIVDAIRNGVWVPGEL